MYGPEFRAQIALATPVSLTTMFRQIVDIVTMSVVGKLGPAELAAATLATSFTNLIGITLVVGLATTLFTVCGQAYGARQYPMVGLWAQRGFIICIIACVAVTGVWFAAEPILLWVGQTPEVSRMTAVYIRFLVPGLYGFATHTCIAFCLQSMGHVRPGAYAALVTAMVHPPLIYLAVHVLGLGLVGAAISTSFANLLQAAVLLGIVRWWQLHERIWPGWSWACLQQQASFLKLAIPGVVLTSEWWVAEIVVASAGLMANASRQLSAMAVYMHTGQLAYTFVFGLAVASSTRVSNELGAGNPKTAQHAALVSVLLTLIVSGTVSTFILVFRYPWARLFTADYQVLALTQKLLILLAGYMILDALQSTLQGIIRGCGKQPIAAFMVFPAYWIVGLPCALALGFKTSLGVLGLSMGMCLGTATYAGAFAGVWLYTNWDLEAEKAAVRAGIAELAQPRSDEFSKDSEMEVLVSPDRPKSNDANRRKLAAHDY